MRFTTRGLIMGVIMAVMAVILVYSVLKFFGYVGPGKDASDPAVLAQEAIDNLEKVRQRKPDDRRPASYDSVMAPLDKMLSQAKALIEAPEYDPVRDFEKIRALTLPVIDIADDGLRQARSETGPLAKEYRFNDQKGEACQYLANAMWERINARLPRRSNPLGDPVQYPEREMNELKRVLDTGIAATQENRSLYYIRGVVYRAEGLWAQAARDMARAVAIDPDYAAAWNVLGLVRINLKEFDLAEEALERARALNLENAARMQQDPGDEYTAIIYNLAMFHERLAAYYNQENRINPTVDARRLMTKHAASARKYLEEFLSREPAGTSDAKDARQRLDALGQ